MGAFLEGSRHLLLCLVPNPDPCSVFSSSMNSSNPQPGQPRARVVKGGGVCLGPAPLLAGSCLRPEAFLGYFLAFALWIVSLVNGRS